METFSLPDIHRVSIVSYVLVVIEKIHRTDSDRHDRIKRLKRKTFWIDILGSKERIGLNKSSEDLLELAQ